MGAGVQEGRKPKRRWPKCLALALLALVAICCIAFAVYTGVCYHASDEALVAVEAGDQSAQYGLVLYPGAKIEPAAYVPLARKLASRGVFCVVVKMPFNIASLDINAATKVMAEYPQVASWWIGGHSLGGAMAAQYASEHASELAGIVFLAAYSAADLSDTDLEACVVYGTDDGVLNFDKFEQAKRNLPADASVLAIEGGNHAGFGCYGTQRHDGQASISPSEQQEQTAQAVAQAILG